MKLLVLLTALLFFINSAMAICLIQIPKDEIGKSTMKVTLYGDKNRVIKTTMTVAKPITELKVGDSFAAHNFDHKVIKEPIKIIGSDDYFLIGDSGFKH